MKDTKKYKESRQLHNGGYSQDSRVELKDTEKVQSISMTSDRKRNAKNAYDSMLLENLFHGRLT